MLVSFGLLAGGLVLSQQPPGGGFGKGKGGKGAKGADHMTLFQNPQVRAELKITEDQLADLPAASLKALAEILDPGQLQRLRQIYLQQKGDSAFLEPDVAGELKLTQEQTKKIQKAFDDQAKQQAALFEEGGFSPAKMQELQKATTAAIQGALTPAQKTAWAKLTGEPFVMAKGGFGGMGGGGKGKKGGAAPATDEKLLADMRPPMEFQVSLFARHPDFDADNKPVGINYPTCICTTPTPGMIFVGCDGNSAQGTAPNRGKIFRVIDSKGTGKADSFTLFCEVDHPRGLIYHNGALYVCHPPDFSVFYDDDGDGKADRHEILVKGVSSPKAVGSRGGDHTTNNITMGIDGWIYFAVGDMGMSEATATKDGAKVTMRGGVARIRPDGTGLETVLWGTRNIYGVAIDPYMNMFTRDNTNDGGAWNVRLNHDIPTAQYGYPSLFINFPDEIMNPLVDYGGGGPTGAVFLDEGALPEPYNHTLFTVDYGRSTIYRHVLEPKGSTFKEKPKQVEFIKCQQPIDLDYDGMGRFYVSSFQGAPFNYAGPNYGYIAQLVHKDVKPTSAPEWKKLAAGELLRHLAGNSAVFRQHAQREILRRGDNDAMARELEQAAAGNGSLAGRVAALFTLKLLRGEKSYAALVKLASNDAVREFALKALADDKEHRTAVPADLFVNALKDANPRVRLQAVIGLGRLGKKEAAAKLVPLLADPDAAIAHVAYRNLWILGAAEECLKALDPASPSPIIAGSTFALQLMHEPKVVDGLAQKLRQVSDTRIWQAAVRALARLYYDEKHYDGGWWGTRPSTKGPYFQTVKWSESDRIAETLTKAIKGADTASLAYLLQEVNRCNVPIAGKAELTVKLALADAKYLPQAVTVLANQNELSPDGLALLRKGALEETAKPTLQAQALRGLHNAAVKAKNFDAVIPVLASLGGPAVAAEVRAARNAFLRDGALADAVPVFGKLTQDADAARRELAYRVLLQIAGNSQLAVAPRNQAGKFLEEAWTKAGTTVSLLRAIGDAEAEEYTLQVKQYLGDKRQDVKEAAGYAAKLIDLDALEKAAKSGSTVGNMPYEDAVASVLKEKGNPKRGLRLFAKQGCVLCHTVSQLETPKGPHLEDIGSKQKREELLESILKPSAKLAQGYETWLVTLQDGRIMTGFVVRESGEEIELRNVGGISTTIPKAQIDTRDRGTISVMPEGLVSSLTVPELASLVAYLESLRTKN
jgi:putative membrane-bound dehydrogenase-like protein